MYSQQLTGKCQTLHVFKPVCLFSKLKLSTNSNSQLAPYRICEEKTGQTPQPYYNLVNRSDKKETYMVDIVLMGTTSSGYHQFL